MVQKNLFNSFLLLFSLSLSFSFSLPSLKFRNYFIHNGNISAANRIFQFLLLSFFFHSHTNPLIFLQYILYLHIPVRFLSSTNPIFHFFLTLPTPSNVSSSFLFSKFFLLLFRSNRNRTHTRTRIQTNRSKFQLK